MTAMTRFAAVLLLLAVCGTPVMAQEGQVLPDLAPREVEITGDLSIAFPSLDRQPLIGFNPPPRVPEIPSDRRPYTPEYKQPSAELPPSPLTRPEPPAVSTIASRVRYTGTIEAGAGLYLERFARADIALVQNDQARALLDLDYRGSAGHEPFSGQSASSEFDRFEGTLRADIDAGDGAVVEGRLGGLYDQYSLFGASPRTGSLSQMNPGRTVTDMSALLGVRSPDLNRILYSASIAGGRSEVDTDVFDPDVRVDPTTNRTETYLSVSAELDVPFGEMRSQTRMAGRASKFDGGTLSDSGLRYGRAASLMSWKPSPRTTVSAGASVAGYDTGVQFPGSRSRSELWLSPEGRITFALSSSSDLYGRIGSTLGDAGLADTYEIMPYLADQPMLLPDLVPLDARAGVRSATKYVTSDVYAGYRDVANRRYPDGSAQSAAPYSAGYPGLEYDDATEYYAGGSLSAIVSTAIQVGIRGEYRQAELAGTKSEIPYYSPLILGGHTSLSVLEGDLVMQVDASYESSRKVDASGTTEAPGVLLLGLETTWHVTDQYALVAGGRHLADEPEYWHRYVREGSVLFAGLRWRW